MVSEERRGGAFCRSRKLVEPLLSMNTLSLSLSFLSLSSPARHKSKRAAGFCLSKLVRSQWGWVGRSAKQVFKVFVFFVEFFVLCVLSSLILSSLSL